MKAMIEEPALSKEEQKNILIDAGKAITEEPIEITIDIIPSNRAHALLQKWGKLPLKRKFAVKPLTLGNFNRVATLLLEMNVNVQLFTSGNILEECYKLAANHSRHIAQIIAITLHNKRELPPDSLVEFVHYNVDSAGMAHLLAIVFKMLGTSNFIHSIVSMKGFVSNSAEVGMNPESRRS